MSPDIIRPIIIVAAGRSGTKMFRNILASHPGLVSFPHEINYIWRYGNATRATDELKPEHARPDSISYIRKRFEKLSTRHGGKHIVEKTCANSLRVEFVRRIFPESYIIHLVRDGRAVAESAQRCWRARPGACYLLGKLPWVPASDVPYYAARYLRYQFGRLASHDKAQTSWGPRFTGLDELVKNTSLIEVCGLQWKACVQAAESAMKGLPSENAMTVRYEDLVKSPLFVMEEVFDNLELTFSPACRVYVDRNVHKGNLNKWRNNLSDHDLKLLIPHIKSELVKQRYIL